MIEPARRSAAMVVSSYTVTLEEMTEALGVQPDVSHAKGGSRPGLRFPRPAKDSSWAITESGDPSIPLSVLVSTLIERVVPLAEPLTRLRLMGCEVKLDVVQYISADGPDGLGFGLEASEVALLAGIGAMIDVDQYHD
jgi:hypothetical protein